jgi:ketosteroid isomerase-like protein
MSHADAAGSDIGGLFAAIDAQDSAAFVSYLTDGAVFRYGSAPPVRGRAAIQEAVDGFFATIAGCSHAIARTVCDGDTLFCEGEVTYRRHDGSKITLPFTNVLEYADDLIDHYKIYIDIAPLYAE